MRVKHLELEDSEKINPVEVFSTSMGLPSECVAVYPIKNPFKVCLIKKERLTHCHGDKNKYLMR